MKTELQGQEWRALIATGLLFAVTYLDYYGVAIALPAIGREFDTSGVELEWVINANLLAFAAPLIAMGRLTDMLGARPMAVTGALVFGAGAALSGLSPGIEILIAGRAVQGLGDAMMSVAAFALLSRAFDGERQSVGLGLLTAIGMVGGVVGPFLSGFITDSLSWRWFFLIIGGVTAAGFILAFLFADKLRVEDGEKKLDITGFLLLTAGLVLLILGLQFVDTGGWLAPKVVGFIAVSLVCFAVFYVVEKRVAAPLVDFSLFRDPSFSSACAVLFLFYFPIGALMVYLALYLQHVLDYTALETGVIYLALMLPTTLVSLVVGRVLQRAGPRLTMAVSVAFITAGFVAFGFVHPTTGLGTVIVGLMLLGTGRGLSGTVPMAIALAAVPKSRAGAATGVIKTISTMSVPIGIATFGAFFRSWENDEIAHIFQVAGSNLTAEMKAEIYGILSGSEAMQAKLASVAPEIATRVELIADEAFSHAFRNLMFLSIALCVAVPIITYLMRHGSAVSGDHKIDKN